MPKSEAEFREPKFIRIETRYPMSLNKDDRYNEICPRHEAGRYRGSEGREGGWKFPGYNPNSNSLRTETINVRAEDLQFKPY